MKSTDTLSNYIDQNNGRKAIIDIPRDNDKISIKSKELYKNETKVS